MDPQNTPQPIQCNAKGAYHIIRGLISYHERMTMGEFKCADYYLEALRFALACVEEKIPKEDAANG